MQQLRPAAVQVGRDPHRLKRQMKEVHSTREDSRAVQRQWRQKRVAVFHLLEGPSQEGRQEVEFETSIGDRCGAAFEPRESATCQRERPCGSRSVKFPVKSWLRVWRARGADVVKANSVEIDSIQVRGTCWHQGCDIGDNGLKSTAAMQVELGGTQSWQRW